MDAGEHCILTNQLKLQGKFAEDLDMARMKPTVRIPSPSYIHVHVPKTYKMFS